MEPEYWAAIAAWVGVGVSWIYSRRAHQSAKESATHEQEALAARRAAAEAVEKLAEIEALRDRERQAEKLHARIYADMRPGPTSSHRILTVRNDGPAIARKVVVWFDGDRLSGPETMEPQAKYEFTQRRGGKVEITWQDGRNERQSWTQTLDCAM